MVDNFLIGESVLKGMAKKSGSYDEEFKSNAATLFEQIDIDCNRHRLHSVLGFLTPEELETKNRVNFTHAT